MGSQYCRPTVQAPQKLNFGTFYTANGELMKLQQLLFFLSPMADSEVVLVTETDNASMMPIRILKAACGLLLWGWAVLFLCTPTPAVARPSTTLFESGQVRPLALSPDGTLLFAVNTPDNRLEIFAVRATGLAASRLGAGRPRAGRGRGAHRRRGLGGEPPLRQRQHRRPRPRR